ncbi:MAG TPA: translation initiation factor IF-2 N-terminal domain-containing protein [Pseudonocardiaceae bacterium]|nr:translation initiation factor IF-2 N-terminal domain-containing protein [Pseudonocardiaceae bacterium]
MSNMAQPAGTAGGDSSTPTHPALADLPDKVRVHALAKLLERSSREVLDVLAALGSAARSAQSNLDREVAVQVADRLLNTAEPTAPAAQSPAEAVDQPAVDTPVAEPADTPGEPAAFAPVFAAPSPVFLPPAAEPAPAKKPAAKKAARDTTKDTARDTAKGTTADIEEAAASAEATDDDQQAAEDEAGARSRRRRRGRRGRGRGKGGPGDDQVDGADDDSGTGSDTGSGGADDGADTDNNADGSEGEDGGAANRRRRRRRRRKGDDASGEDDPPNTVVHVRDGRDEKDRPDRSDSGSDEVRSVRGSTRLEAKRQRRRDGRDAGRRRVPILSEAEFLARREAVDRKMVVRELNSSVQIGVLEDGVLVEHFVTASGTGSLVGNVYLGRVQNVLPSMEAAFVDIGRGRNAVLYAGEVDWDAAGLEGKARKIEQALSTGDSVLVQVTKDPVGHKGARLTTQISLPGRFLVYVPGGGATGISRKLPDTERKRLKDVLKRVVPEDAGVIIRTASEGIAEDELARDVRRLRAQWEIIQEKASSTSTKAPQLLYEEPDLLIKVVRDLFTEDFSALIVQGSDPWDTIEAYVKHVAPDLSERLKRHVGNTDVFTEHRIDEQILKALDRKVWLPSGGYLVIDRTEAMTVIDVNTGKFTGAGGNLEETVTRNNLEAAEEIVRQLRLRDIGGIIVIDFIDMVLESNRDLVLRRLTECLGRDRTRHQVAEVTSLGLVQMTRKRVGTGLLEAYSTTCEHCRGRGVVVSTTPVLGHSGNSGNGGNGGGSNGGNGSNGRKTKHREPEVEAETHLPSPAASVIRSIHQAAEPAVEGEPAELAGAAAQTNGHIGHEPEREPETESAAPTGSAEPAESTEPEPSLVVARRRRPRRRAASRPAGPPATDS